MLDRPTVRTDGVLLTEARTAHLSQLAQWFDSVESAQRWGGPRIRFPFVPEQFAEDIRWGQMPAHALIADGQLCGFGQTYLHHGRCHLARLVVAPDWRGRGLGHRLVGALMRQGAARFATAECSLYVLGDNAAALACYRSNGFTVAPNPDGAPQLPGCLFMTAPAPG